MKRKFPNTRYFNCKVTLLEKLTITIFLKQIKFNNYQQLKSVVHFHAKCLLK